MLTIETAQVDVFPLKKGDRVKVSWKAPAKLVKYGYIHELHTSWQWGKEVVYCIMVKIDGMDKPVAVGFDILEKVWT
jgi:hypothetical protein